MTMKTKQVPLDIYIPATEHRAAVKVNTLQIDVHSDDFGNEMVIPESSILIDKTQARYMGLLADSGIRSLRERLFLSQDQLSGPPLLRQEIPLALGKRPGIPEPTRQHPAPAA